MTEHTKPPGIELLDRLTHALMLENDALHGTTYYYVITSNGGEKMRLFEVRLHRADGTAHVREVGKNGKRLEETIMRDEEIRRGMRLRLVKDGTVLSSHGDMHIEQIVRSRYWFNTRNDLAFGAHMPYTHSGGLRTYHAQVKAGVRAVRMEQLTALGRMADGKRPNPTKHYYFVCDHPSRTTYGTAWAIWDNAHGTFVVNPRPDVPVQQVDPTCTLAIGLPFHTRWVDRHGRQVRTPWGKLLYIVEADQPVEMNHLRRMLGIGQYKPRSLG